jgi:enoyl-CoA hydratase/carnithine racemase
MVYKEFILERKERLLTIKINDAGNDPIKIIGLSDELENLRQEICLDESIWLVILTGSEEKAFSIDPCMIRLDTQSDGGIQEKVNSLTEGISKLNIPVIAAINGDAIGLGLELALSCDVRISTAGSWFGFPHTGKGVIPWDGRTQRLPRLVGRAKALEMILTGAMINAQEAYRIGLVNKVVSSEDLAAVVMKMAQEMVSKAPFSLKYAKEAIYKGMDLTLEQGLRLEADLYFLLHTARDRAEGIQAFREKRTPRFEGK